MCKRDVDRYPSGPLVPCQVKMRWVGGGNDHFYHRVKFSGAKEESYRLALTLPTSIEGQSPQYAILNSLLLLIPVPGPTEYGFFCVGVSSEFVCLLTLCTCAGGLL